MSLLREILTRLLAWLGELFSAQRKLRRAHDDLFALTTEYQLSESGVKELRAALADASEKHRNAMNSLAACITEKQASREALHGVEVALDTAREQIEALRASQAGLQASEAALKARITALRAWEAGRQENELLLNEKVAAQAQHIADLNERYGAYILPPLPETTTTAKPLEWVADILTPLISELVPGVKDSPTWLDGTYYLVPVETYQPLMDHWRKYLMRPFVPETDDCDDRVIDFRAWAHRWSDGLFQPGIVIGTTPWALKDGEPYPHAFGIVVNPDGKVWVLDPALNPVPAPWSDEITMWKLIY